ncbi:MAG: glycosyltransferase family 4 protein [Candidatus Omnitrophota bacterium]
MRIIQLVHSFPPYTVAGTEVYTYELSQELQKRHKVFIFFRINDQKKKEYEIVSGNIDNLEIYAINNTFRRCDSFESTYNNFHITDKFAQLLDRIQPDIIHIQHLLFLSISIIKEAKKRKIPIVFTLNDYWLMCHMGQLLRRDGSLCELPMEEICSECLITQLSIKNNSMAVYQFLRKWVSNIFLQLLKNAYLFYAKVAFLNKNEQLTQIRKRISSIKEVNGLVDVFIAPSNFIKERFIKFGFSEERIKVLPYGLDMRNFKDIAKTLSDKIRFGYIGTLLPPKGVDILIKAFNNINADMAELKIYGRLLPYAGYENYPAYLKNLARNKGIVFMGGFKNSDIGKILSGIDVLIIPSIWYENAPFVIQEAFKAMVPVIAADIGGIPEFVKDGVNGLLFKSGDVNDLRARIEYIINNPNIMEEFRKNMPDVKSIEENSKEIERIYVELTGKPKCF